MKRLEKVAGTIAVLLILGLLAVPNSAYSEQFIMRESISLREELVNQGCHALSLPFQRGCSPPPFEPT